MQLELKHLQSRTGTTFVYVTHDQEEAMTMSDRIAVMRGGVVEQLGRPRELYATPASPFVAGFIGVSNLVTLRVDRRGDGVVAMDLGGGDRILAPDPGGSSPEITVTVRPEWIKTGGEPGTRDSRVTGTVADVVYLGSVTQLVVGLPTGERLTVHRLNDEIGATDPAPGERVTLRWAADHSYVIGSRAGASADGGADAADPAQPAAASSGAGSAGGGRR
jgi:spermidine/putrescine transport system ATP-binding protein